MSEKPLIYSCSGCSNVAQLANDIAVTMDREGHAQMSCIVGVGGHVKGLVKLAQSGRPIMALDGCKVSCVKRTLVLHKVKPRWHIDLTSFGLKKTDGTYYNLAQSTQALRKVQELLHTIEITT